MNDFAIWVSQTSLSLWIQQTLWVVPWLQIIHIVAISIVLASTFMVGLRILSLTGHGQTMTQTAKRFLPWMWGGLIMLAASGSLLIIGEPVRSLINVAFWIKMTLLLIAVSATLVFQTTFQDSLAFWEGDHDKQKAVRALVILSFFVWCGVAVAGRWIAYAFVPSY